MCVTLPCTRRMTGPQAQHQPSAVNPSLLCRAHSPKASGTAHRYSPRRCKLGCSTARMDAQQLLQQLPVMMCHLPHGSWDQAQVSLVQCTIRAAFLRQISPRVTHNRAERIQAGVCMMGGRGRGRACQGVNPHWMQHSMMLWLLYSRWPCSCRLLVSITPSLVLELAINTMGKTTPIQSNPLLLQAHYHLCHWPSHAHRWDEVASSTGLLLLCCALVLPAKSPPLCRCHTHCSEHAIQLLKSQQSLGTTTPSPQHSVRASCHEGCVGVQGCSRAKQTHWKGCVLLLLLGAPLHTPPPLPTVMLLPVLPGTPNCQACLLSMLRCQNMLDRTLKVLVCDLTAYSISFKRNIKIQCLTEQCSAEQGLVGLDFVVCRGCVVIHARTRSLTSAQLSATAVLMQSTGW